MCLCFFPNNAYSANAWETPWKVLQVGSTEYSGGSNHIPTARAGSSINEITGAGRITLSAHTSSDPDNDTLSYLWQQSSPTSPVIDF